MFQKLVILALAGSLGTLARYGLGGLVQRLTGASFPWGTWAVNALGCFLFGAFWALASGKFALSGEVRTFVLIGFMGAFTTFSTFASESGQLIDDSQWTLVCGNILLHNVGGIGLFFLGRAVGYLI